MTGAVERAGRSGESHLGLGSWAGRPRQMAPHASICSWVKLTPPESVLVPVDKR